MAIKDPTATAKKLLKMSASARRRFLMSREGRTEALSGGMTPTERALLFPDYFKKTIPEHMRDKDRLVQGRFGGGPDGHGVMTPRSGGGGRSAWRSGGDESTEPVVSKYGSDTIDALLKGEQLDKKQTEYILKLSPEIRKKFKIKTHTLPAGISVGGQRNFITIGRSDPSDEAIEKRALSNQRGTEGLTEAIAASVSRGETGSGKIGIAQLAQAAPDAKNSRSYGFMGMNSGPNHSSGTIHTFIKKYPELGFGNLKPGSAAFNNKWAQVSRENAAVMKKAQLEFFEENFVNKTKTGLKHSNIPEHIQKDPAVISYFTDKAIQQGAGSIKRDSKHIAKAWDGAKGDINNFLVNMNQNEREHLKTRFESAYKSGQYRERGNETRLKKRLRGAHEAAKVKSSKVSKDDLSSAQDYSYQKDKARQQLIKEESANTGRSLRAAAASIEAKENEGTISYLPKGTSKEIVAAFDVLPNLSPADKEIRDYWNKRNPAGARLFDKNGKLLVDRNLLIDSMNAGKIFEAANPGYYVRVLGGGSGERSSSPNHRKSGPNNQGQALDIVLVNRKTNKMLTNLPGYEKSKGMQGTISENALLYQTWFQTQVIASEAREPGSWKRLRFGGYFGDVKADLMHTDTRGHEAGTSLGSTLGGYNQNFFNKFDIKGGGISEEEIKKQSLLVRHMATVERQKLVELAEADDAQRNGKTTPLSPIEVAMSSPEKYNGEIQTPNLGNISAETPYKVEIPSIVPSLVSDEQTEYTKTLFADNNPTQPPSAPTPTPTETANKFQVPTPEKPTLNPIQTRTVDVTPPTPPQQTPTPAVAEETDRPPATIPDLLQNPTPEGPTLGGETHSIRVAKQRINETHPTYIGGFGIV